MKQTAKLSSSFAQNYSALNPNQQKAVDTLEGPVLVLAGPGTGKTQVLTLRIAKILKDTDTDPGSILALTFTEAAAKEMRQRLINLVGQAGYYVKITTFHAFCADIISENPERFSRPAGMLAATDLEKIEIITKILEENSFLLLKPLNNPTLYLRDIIGSLSDLKREGITLTRFAQIITALNQEFESEKDSLKKTALAEREKLISKNIDLLSIYQKYQEELVKLGRFDFEDMINWVVEAFETDEDFLLSYQEKFQYILVDEYQDTNSAQNRLIFSLAKYWGENANIFVVGDPNQSIFRFQGASQENTNQFKKTFPKAIKVTLDQNYRSTASILSSAATLINDTPLNHNVDHEPVPVKVARFDSQVFEDKFLISSIKDKIKNGISPSDIAIIAKENKDLDHLANLMKQNGLPFRLEGSTNVLATPLISQFLKILKITTNLSGAIDDLDLFTVLNYPYFNLDPLSVLKISRLAHTKHIALVDLLQTNEENIDSKIKTVFNLFVSWSQAASSLTLSEIFQKIFQESGLSDYIIRLPLPITELNRFVTLYENVKLRLLANPSLDLVSFVKSLDLMEQHGIKLPESPLHSNQEAITLTTAHKSKGLEWLVVYIYRFADTHWGNKTNRQMIKLPDGIIESDLSKEDKNADERRLFYVALTRAKKEIFLSGAVSYSHSTRMTFPAMFLSDLPEKHIENIDTSIYETETTQVLASLLTPSLPTVHEGEDEYLKELITNFKLSPTALNTYLECHYKFKLDNLYRIPRAKAPSMCFGTAVHIALENLYRHLNKTGKLNSKETFLSDFESALKREVLSQNEFKDRLNHGKKILSAYYDHYQGEFEPSLFTEKNLGFSTTSPILLDDISLSGKLDRIDLLDKKNNTVRFVDYKTGSPKSRSMLEKQTDDPDGNYKRQLVFYHLLAELDPSFHYQIAETELDFIETDKMGNFHKEKFSIEKEEVESLKETIKNSMSEIRNLNFERTTNKQHCLRCDFKNHCWPSGIPSE